MNINKKIKAITAVVFCLLTTPVFAEQDCETASIPLSTPDSRFTINSDATVMDRETGLTWKRCSQGQTGDDCSGGTASTFTWQAALKAAQDESFIEKSDWRVPNVKELMSLIEHACWQPTINLTVFPNTPSGEYWSGTPDTDVDAFFNATWSVGFQFGNAANSFRTSEYHVRLVRGSE